MVLLSNITDQLSKAARRLSMTSSTTSTASSSQFNNHESNSSHHHLNHKKKRQSAPLPSASSPFLVLPTSTQTCHGKANNDDNTLSRVGQPQLPLQEKHGSTTTTSPSYQQQYQQGQQTLFSTTLPFSCPSSSATTASEGAQEAHKQQQRERVQSGVGVTDNSNHHGRPKNRDRDSAIVDRNKDQRKDKVKVGKHKVSEMVQALELAQRPSSPSLLQHSALPVPATPHARASHRPNVSHDTDISAPFAAASSPTTTATPREHDASLGPAYSPSTRAFSTPEISPGYYDSYNPEKTLPIPPRPSKDTHSHRVPIQPSSSSASQNTYLPSAASSLPSTAHSPRISSDGKEREKETAKKVLKDDKPKKAKNGDKVIDKHLRSLTVAPFADSSQRMEQLALPRHQHQQQSGYRNGKVASTVMAESHSTSPPPPSLSSHRQHGIASQGNEPVHVAVRSPSPMGYMPQPSSLPRPLVGGYRGFNTAGVENDCAVEDESGSYVDDDGSSLQMEDFFFSGQNGGVGSVNVIDYEFDDDLDIYLGPTNKSTLDISKIKRVSNPLLSTGMAATDEAMLRLLGDGSRPTKAAQLSALERLQIQQRRVSQEQQRLADMVLPPSTTEEKRAVSGMLPTREVVIDAIPALQQHQLFRHHEEAHMSPVSPPRPPERPFSPTPPSVASQQYVPSPQSAGISHDPSSPVVGDSDSAKLDQLLSLIPGPNRPRLPTQLEWQRNLAELTQRRQVDDKLPQSSSKASRRQSQPSPREAHQLQQQQQADGGQLKQSKKQQPYKLNAAGGLAWSLAHLQDEGSGDEDTKSRRHSMPEMVPQHLKTSAQKQQQQQQQHSSTPEPAQAQARQGERTNFAQGVAVVRDNGNNQNKRRSGLEWVLQPDLVDEQSLSRPVSGTESLAPTSPDPGAVGNEPPKPTASRLTLSDKDALDQAFEDMLISLSISEAARERLHQLPKDHKWAMIQANDAHPALYETPDTLPPAYFIEALQSYMPPTIRNDKGLADNGKDVQTNNAKVKQLRRHSSSASTSSALSAHDAILQNRKRSNSSTMASTPIPLGGGAYPPPSSSSQFQSASRPFSQSLTQLLGGTKSEKKVLEEREQVLQKLRILIKNGSVRWCKEFFRVGGARALLEFGNYIVCSEETKYGQKERLLYQSIQCIKSMVAIDEGVAALKSESQFFPLLRKLVLQDYTLSSPSTAIKDKKHGRSQSPALVPPSASSSRPMSPTALFYATGGNGSSSKLSLRPTTPTSSPLKGQPMGRTRSRSGSIPKPLSTLSLIPVGGSMVNLHAVAGTNIDKRSSSASQQQQQQQQRPTMIMAEMLLSGLSNIQGALNIVLTLLSKSPDLKETILRETVANPNGGSAGRNKTAAPHVSSSHHPHPHSSGKDASDGAHVRRGSLTMSSSPFGQLLYSEWVAHLNKMIQICERDQQARQELQTQYQQVLEETSRPRSPASANGYFYQRRRQTDGSSRTSTLLGLPQGSSPPGGGNSPSGLTKILGLRRATSPIPVGISTPPSSPSSAVFQWGETRKRRNSATAEDGGFRLLGDVASLAASANNVDQVGDGRELLACLMLHLDLAKILMQDMGGPSGLSLGFAKSVKDGRVDESLERLKSYLDATRTFTTLIQEVLHLIALVPPHTTRMNASSLIRNLPERSQSPLPTPMSPLSSSPLDKCHHPSDDSGSTSHHHGHHRSTTTSTLSHADATHPRLPSGHANSSNGNVSGVSASSKTRKAADAAPVGHTKEVFKSQSASSAQHLPVQKGSKAEKQPVGTHSTAKSHSKESSSSTANLAPISSTTAVRGSVSQQKQQPSRNVSSPLGYRSNMSCCEELTEEEPLSTSPTVPMTCTTPTQSDKTKKHSRHPSHQRHGSSLATTTMLPVPLKNPRRPSMDASKPSPVAATANNIGRRSDTHARLNNASSSSTKSSGSTDDHGGVSPGSAVGKHSSKSATASAAVASVTIPEKNPSRMFGRHSSVSESIYERGSNEEPSHIRTASTSILQQGPAQLKMPTRSPPTSPVRSNFQRPSSHVPRSPTMNGLNQYAMPEAEANAPNSLAADKNVTAPQSITETPLPSAGGGSMLRPRYQKHLQSLSEASSTGSTSLGSSSGGLLSFQEASTDSTILSSARSSVSYPREPSEHKEEHHKDSMMKEEENGRVVVVVDCQQSTVLADSLLLSTVQDEKPLPPSPSESREVGVPASKAKKTVTLAAPAAAKPASWTSIKSSKGREGEKEDEKEDDKEPSIDFDAHIHDNVRKLAASSSTSNIPQGSKLLAATAAVTAHRSITPTSIPFGQQHHHPFLRSSTSSQLMTLSTPSLPTANRPTSLYVTSSSSLSATMQHLPMVASAKSDTDPKILSAPIIVPENVTRVQAQYLQSQLSQIVLPPMEDVRKKENVKAMADEDLVACVEESLVPAAAHSNRSSVSSFGSASTHSSGGVSPMDTRKKATTGLADRIRLFDRP